MFQLPLTGRELRSVFGCEAGLQEGAGLPKLDTGQEHAPPFDACAATTDPTRIRNYVQLLIHSR